MRALLLRLIVMLPFALLLNWTSKAQNDLQLNFLSTYQTNVFDAGAAEIAAFDAMSARLFFTNADANTVTILDISNPSMPTKVKDVDMTIYGGGVNSVAVYNGLVAVAVESNNKTDDGKVVFFDTNGDFISEVTVGALPDMVTFSHDGTKVLTANEGEPNSDYSVDPEGSVSIIDVSNGAANATVMTVNFQTYNDKKTSLLNKGIRIYGPNATVAQDLEPEYVALAPDDARAYVTLQENNAIAVIDVANAKVLDIFPLGYKDHFRGAPVLSQFKINELVDLPVIGTPIFDSVAQAPVKLSGFSGLYFDASESTQTKYVFYTIPDRGPNEEPISPTSVTTPADLGAGALSPLRPFKLPDYQARIVKFEVDILTGSVTFGETLLNRMDGDQIKPITGKGNVIGFDETPVQKLKVFPDTTTVYDGIDYLDTTTNIGYRELSPDPYGGDFEGIVKDKDGNFWACDENRPSLYKFAPDGMMIERYVPKGTAALTLPILGFSLEEGFYGKETLPEVYSKRWANRGFEAIAYDSDEDIIYGFIQSPMFNPGNSTQNKSDVIRILGINPEDGTPVSEYVYLLERNRDGGLAQSRVDKIGDAVYTGNGKFLVLERDSSFPEDEEGKKYVYEINLVGATNIVNTPLSLQDSIGSNGEKTLELMSADELGAAGIVAVHKTKILNLPSIGYLPSDKAEGIALLPNGTIAVLNDNDFGLAGAGITDDCVLGIITFAQNYGLDASDRDNGINILPQPVWGMFQPDAIATYEADGKTYIMTVNEGDAREYDTFEEEARISSLTLDPTAFPDAAALQANAVLGRLNVTNKLGDIDGDEDFDQLHPLGGRSFTVWDVFGNLVFDSGDALEQITATAYPAYFNASNTDNALDSRSDNKGPEPEALTIAEIDGIPHAFVGMERIGGVALFNIEDPKQPVFVKYINNRDFTMSVESAAAGDLGPENIVFVSAADSPNGDALMVVANEISGSVSIFTFGELTDVDDPNNVAQEWRIFPNPVDDAIFTNVTSDFAVYNTVGQLLLNQKNTNRLNVNRLPKGTYLLRDLKNGRAQLFVKQ
ncbi:MAG: choice-of-anchor I family protein [Saprospiraceae bacterium]|nr:choice-of-anchor I family protein [Saprospiraceae bacterium]